MSHRQIDQGSSFAIGFALGLFGGCLGLAVAPIVHRHCLPGALAGFMVNSSILVCLGLVDLFLPGVDIFFHSGIDPNSIDAIEQINLDGTPIQGDSPPILMIAVLTGALMALLGVVAAAWLFLRPDQDEPED